MGIAVKASLHKAESIKEQLVEKQLLDATRKIRREGKHIYFPVIAEDTAFDVVEVDLEQRELVVSLREALGNELTNEEFEFLKTAYDIVGTIAILEVDQRLRNKERVIAEKLLATNPVVQTVVRKDGGHEGELRIQQYKHLAGVQTTEATVSENGVRLTFEIDKAYYSVRSSTERKRIASLVQKDERVLVMFSGIGPFVCVLSKNTEAKEVIGVELNKDGHRFASQNVKQNKLVNAIVLQGDVRDVVPTLGKFDRILMPLPHTAQDFLDVAVPAVSGMIHLYHFDSEEAVNAFAKTLPDRIKELGKTGKVKHVQKCGNLGPGIHRWSIDIEIT